MPLLPCWRASADCHSPGLLRPRQTRRLVDRRRDCLLLAALRCCCSPLDLLAPQCAAGTTGVWRLVAKSAPFRFACPFVADAYRFADGDAGNLIGWIALRFSATYLHREIGFHRFFLRHDLFLWRHAADRSFRNAVLALSAGNSRRQFLVAHRVRLGAPPRDGQRTVRFLTNRGRRRFHARHRLRRVVGRDPSSGPGWG